MIRIYHPSKSGKGFAMSIQDSNQNDCVFATLIKQSGWSEETKTGTFAASREDKNSITTVKFNDLECAALLNVIERGQPFSSFHSGDIEKGIQFTPWFPKVAEGEKSIQKGFSFSITLNPNDATTKNSFYIGLSYPEGRLIREYLINCLNSHFNSQREIQKNQPKKNYSISTKEIADGIHHSPTVAKDADLF
jgi:hypothetical protein